MPFGKIICDAAMREGNMRAPAMNTTWGGRQDMAVILAYVDKPDF